MKDESLCIIVKCEKRKQSRGLCTSCLAAARKYIMDGRATWEFLEKNKMALPSHIGLFSQQFSTLPDKFEDEGNEKWKALGE